MNNIPKYGFRTFFMYGTDSRKVSPSNALELNELVMKVINLIFYLSRTKMQTEIFKYLI